MQQTKQHLHLTLANFGSKQPAENVPHAVSSDKKGGDNTAVATARKHENLQDSTDDEENYGEAEDERVEATRCVGSAHGIGDRLCEPHESQDKHGDDC